MFQLCIQNLFSHHNNSEYVNELTCHYSSSSPDRPKHILMACVSFQTLDIQGPKTYKETWRRNLDYTLCLVFFLFLVLICMLDMWVSKRMIYDRKLIKRRRYYDDVFIIFRWCSICLLFSLKFCIHYDIKNIKK